MGRPKRPDRERHSALSAEVRAWVPAGWEELKDVWRDLAPDLIEAGQAAPARRFRSSPIDNQQAGTVFERWIVGALQASGAEVGYPYTVPDRQGPRGRIAEEHDGLVFDGWQGFLVQSKFCPSAPLDIEPIAKLKTRLESRPATTLGLFFSAFRISVTALSEAGRFQPIRLLIFQADDIRWAIQNEDMRELVRRKWRSAVKHGRIDFEIDS